jgi:cytochrome P450
VRTVTDATADQLTVTELVSTAFLLVMAGFDTTVNLIAAGTLALLTHPREMARLRADRSLLPAAVEELLRFTSPVNHANDLFMILSVRTPSEPPGISNIETCISHYGDR